MLSALNEFSVSIFFGLLPRQSVSVTYSLQEKNRNKRKKNRRWKIKKMRVRKYTQEEISQFRGAFISLWYDMIVL